MLVNLLRKLVATPSVAPHEQDISSFCAQWLSDHGFAVETVTTIGGRDNLIASKGNGEKAVCFYGHLDTVSLIDEDRWRSNPYELEEKDGRFYGLGISDMKGGIAAFLTACEKVSGYSKIVLTVDEEDISRGAWDVVGRKKDFFSDVPLIVSAEPCFNLPEHILTNGRAGRVVFDVDFLGESAHLINYLEGSDAIRKLAKFMNDFYEDDVFLSSVLRGQIRKIKGGSVGMSVPKLAHAEVEIIYRVGNTVERLGAGLARIAKGGTVSLCERDTPYLKPYIFNAVPYAEIFDEVVGKYLKEEVGFDTRSSVGDDNVFATLDVPVVTWGPKGGNEHSSNEFVEIRSLYRLVEMYDFFLNKFFGNF